MSVINSASVLRKLDRITLNYLTWIRDKKIFIQVKLYSMFCINIYSLKVNLTAIAMKFRILKDFRGFRILEWIMKCILTPKKYVLARDEPSLNKRK